jgi:hypothetical protein
MKSNVFEWTARSIAVLVVLAVSISALAENPRHKTYTFSGVMNAYSPQTTATGPYEIRGPWSLKLKGDKADFSAALDMELSDGWVITKNGGIFDPNARGAHTHHITLVDADDEAARLEAERRNIPVQGTLGVLDLAAEHGLLVDLPDNIQRLRSTNFRASKKLFDFFLERDGLRKEREAERGN